MKVMMRAPTALFALAGLLLLTILISLQLGSYPLRLYDLYAVLSQQGTPQQELVLFSIRLPRLLLAILTGCGLAVSGAILQAVFRNDLADPGLLGLSAGAGLMIILLLWMQQNGQQNGLLIAGLWRPVAAFCGAALSASLIYTLARKKGAASPARILLTGIAINAGLNAVTLVLAMSLDRSLYDQALVWLSGSLSGKTCKEIILLLPWFICLLPLLMLRLKVLDILALGDEAATALGLQVGRQRLLMIAIAVALTGASVAVAGGIGFVGLLAPHMCRRLFGARHILLLPACALSGAILVVIADNLGRTVLAPVEMPAGIFCAMIGAPYFLYLLMKTSR
ncbi:MAG: iron ABC transporter permease [Brucellaceae bacterium]|jgi:iron complex transport system permease protein|nr:iron ABC transporter permease [Brucellaceae bacterium]